MWHSQFSYNNSIMHIQPKFVFRILSCNAIDVGHLSPLWLSSENLTVLQFSQRLFPHSLLSMQVIRQYSCLYVSGIRAPVSNSVQEDMGLLHSCSAFSLLILVLTSPQPQPWRIRSLQIALHFYNASPDYSDTILLSSLLSVLILNWKAAKSLAS